MTEGSWDWEWIDSPDRAKEIAESIQSENFLAIDTETVGWETGNERLCLIQIGIPSRETVVIIDPLAVTDLKLLDPILIAATPLLVAHNAPFEERQFGRHGIKLRGVVDTLTMARSLRPDLPNHTLQTCCKLLLGMEISKAEQVSDWSRRPLTREQMKYAALDAEVTVKLYRLLREMEEKITLDPDAKVPSLMQQLAETYRDRFQLLKDVSPELALLDARAELIRGAIRERLIDGEPAYEGDFGKCFVTKIKKTEINPQRVRESLPALADEVITEFVDKKRLLAIMKEHGVPEGKLDLVTDITGYTDRMTLTVKDI